MLPDRSGEDRSRIGSVLLPHESPEYGEGFIGLQAPDERDLARWLFGWVSTIHRHYGGNVPRKRKVARVHQSLIDFDAATRDLRAAVAGARSRHARGARRDAQRRRVRAKRRLEFFLRTGLEAREGERLDRDETTWLHLTARGFAHPKLRVCEQCAVVFRAPRARRCLDCRRRPVRIHLDPLRTGGRHVAFRVGGRWATDEFDRTVHYQTVCAGCGTRFDATRADAQYCRNCRSGSGRVRRHRGGSRTGRQSYRFVHAEGARDWSISFATLDGRTEHFEAVDGVIETDDAELAVQIEAAGARPVRL